MSIAYRVMKNLIKQYQNGRCFYTKERLLTMCNVYYGAGQFESDEEYMEIVTEITALPDEQTK